MGLTQPQQEKALGPSYAYWFCQSVLLTAPIKLFICKRSLVEFLNLQHASTTSALRCWKNCTNYLSKNAI